MKNEVVVTMNYGIVRRGVSYRVLSKGYDCLCVSARGKPVWIPEYVLDSSNDRFYREEEQEQEEYASE